jgi:hypothetical protein
VSRLIRLTIVAILVVFALLVAWQLLTLAADLLNPRSRPFLLWSQGQREGLMVVQQEACPGAPFVLPASGWIGLLYGDPRGPYSASSPHQGIDIFSDSDPGLTPVYAAYDGYVTREAEWVSTVIQRVPQDPLNPEQQIWLYYTHMADREGNDFIEDAFPPGTREFFVEQGTLLGYTGDYNGGASRDIWVHLHFSVVRDDGQGGYANELDFANTLDPSPYLSMAVNYACPAPEAGCAASPGCLSDTPGLP